MARSNLCFLARSGIATEGVSTGSRVGGRIIFAWDFAQNGTAVGQGIANGDPLQTTIGALGYGGQAVGRFSGRRGRPEASSSNGQTPGAANVAPRVTKLSRRQTSLTITGSQKKSVTTWIDLQSRRTITACVNRSADLLETTATRQRKIFRRMRARCDHKFRLITSGNTTAVTANVRVSNG